MIGDSVKNWEQFLKNIKKADSLCSGEKMNI